MTKRTGAVARKLADELRARDDDALAALLRARPDLLSPLPTDITNLVARANTYASILRALEQFDAFTLQVVDALVYLPDPATFDAVHLLLRPAEPADVRAALERLRECALLWGDEQALHLVRTVRDVVAPESASRGMRLRTALGGYPPARLRDLMEDLGLPAATDPVSAAAAIAELVADQQRFADLIAAAPPQAKELLDSLSEGPSWGQVANANRPVRTATAESPLEWLLARGLLVALDRDTVVLPAEVAVAVRGGRLHTAVTAVPPALDATPHNAEDVDRTAAGQAYAAITRVEELLDAWALDPPAMLRAGGLGVRELRRAAALIDADEPTAALLIETAFAAGLVAPNGEPDELVLPTPEYDAWRAMDPAARWAALAHAWVEMPRLPSLVGTRDERDRPLAALAPEVIRTLAPPLRRAALNELAELEPGTAVTPDSLLRRLTWLRPRHNPRLREEVLPAALGEAEILGVTGRGALASYARPLVIPTAPEGDDDRERAAAHAMAPLLPRPIDHVFIQADLTAIAPGPLVRGLAAQLAVAADVESTGGATVYRFTERSIRRALDMGRTAAELHELLRRHSRTPVPQPLSYLIDDVARRHGRIRIGTAAAYVRCDDEAVLTELLADRRAARLGLRRLAPTVLVSDSSGASLLEGLRAMGYAPAEESADGAVIVRRPEARRSAPRSRPAQLGSWAMQAPTDTLVRRAVQVLRAGDRAANRTTDRAAYWSSDPAAHWNSNPLRDPARDRAVYQAAFRRLLQPDSTAELLDRLQEAVQTEAALQIGYVDDYGAVSEHEVHPLLVQGGYLTAYNRAQQRIETFAIHRIVDVDPPDLPE